MGLRRLLVGLCAACCIVLGEPIARAPAQPAGAPAKVWSLPELMQSLAQVKSSSAQFTERQTMRMLNAPLVTSGTLRYVAPDWMQKTTTSPISERFVLDRGQVTMSGGSDNKTHVFSIADYPQIGGLVAGILATLAGDLPTLDRYYAVQLSGGPRGWQLLLRPKDASLARFITWIRIDGDENRISVIDTQNSNGDHSEMSIVEDVGDDG